MKNLTEQKVLNKLHIKDFRHLTKDSIMEFVSLYDKMDPEVAKKALEQFPDFAKSMCEVAGDYKEAFKQALENNKECVTFCYQLCSNLHETLQKELENDDLSFEQKQYYIEQMKNVIEEMHKIDKEDKEFLQNVLGKIGLGLLAIAAALAAGIGINLKFNKRM